MTEAGRPVREDDLHAYVDGFLDPEDRSRVERYLAANADAAARVEAWRRGRDALRRATAFKAREPVPVALDVERLAQRRLARRWEPRRAAAGIAVALCVGASAGWLARGSDIETGVAALGAQAAMIQRTFAADPVRPVEFGPDARAELVSWAGRRLGHAITIPDLSPRGYQLLGGRLIATEQGPGLMVLYQGRDGCRITVFMRDMVGVDVDAPMRPVTGKGAVGYVWARDGLGFSLVSSEAAPALRDLSDEVEHQEAARA